MARILNTGNFSDHLLSFIWLLFLVFPNNQIFFLFVPAAYIVLFNYKKNIGRDVSQYLLILPVFMFISFLFNSDELFVNLKSINRVLVLILLFITFGRLRGSKILAPYIYIAIGFLVISQFSSILSVTPINSFINAYYSNAEGEGIIDANSSFEMESYGSFRLGGIYMNSNQYARYLELILVVLLCEIKQFNKRNQIILFSIIVFSLIATGSRTSLIVLSAITLYYLYSSGSLSFQKAFLLTALMGLGIVMFSIYSEITDIRALKVEEGMDNSFGVKLELLQRYIDANPPIDKLLIGNFDGEALKEYIDVDYKGMDFDIGNLLLCFGLLFMIGVMMFYIRTYRSLLPKYRVIFAILLWMFSSSILFSYRMAALWILVLGLYYSRSRMERKL